jgi:hypothetical protein
VAASMERMWPTSRCLRRAMGERDFPLAVAELLTELRAPRRLVTHLELVHEAASALAGVISDLWPGVGVDDDAIHFGAATHDIGKIEHPEELYAPGYEHEEAGYRLLLRRGVDPALARFARTHRRWQEGSTIEDLLVALADRVWRGKRDEDLEMAVARRLSEAAGEELWASYSKLDDLLTRIAAGADSRIERQGG